MRSAETTTCDDSRLHDGARAIHAGHDLDVDGAAFGGRAGARRIADGVALGMLDPQILGGPLQALRDIVANAARETSCSRWSGFRGSAR